MTIMRNFFLTTSRLGFSHWQSTDMELAQTLWGDINVVRYIHQGPFSDEEVTERLNTEMAQQAKVGAQYWPIFWKAEGTFIGACGLRPADEPNIFEFGIHLRPSVWHQGVGMEAGQAAITYGFNELNAKKIVTGHNPNNIGSQKLLAKLGFEYYGKEFYAPTGLEHPMYRMTPAMWAARKY
ncbi:hypothetical protein FD35_GL001025 [Furfurilactobacillus rossiae DSM 15814]|uniref:N-acetyltransferase domain-containing protein n=2 Tax=Furfurilactobacillus rossiae TaxID=231049 RepID=A0A0R1RA01_9LACO|nr:hypothetical protein FD35_GL001025 [Furfurilactobacillus rossiae DSM 15814]